VPLRLCHFLPPLYALTALGCGGGDLVLPNGGGPAQLMIMRGNQQEAVAGEPVADSLVVRLVDTIGLGIPNRAVTWVVSIGDGQVAPEIDTTDAAGLASTAWTLGAEPGANAVRAMLAGDAFVTFTAVGRDGGGGSAASASRSTVVADPSSIAAVIGTSAITVTVRDDRGNPVEGATVSLQASGAGATVAQTSGATGTDGVTIGAVSSAEAGIIVVSATVNGSVRLDQTAEVTVNAAQPPVDHFVFRLQPHTVDAREPFRVEVALVDVVGNVVDLSGVLIYVGLFEEGKDTPVNTRLLGNRFRDTENGVAIFDDLAVTKKGRYRLRALSDQLPELGPHGPEPFLFSITFEVK
jgi:hypothetical protein